MNWVVKLKAVHIDQVMISDRAKIFMQGGREKHVNWVAEVRGSPTPITCD